MGNLFSEPTPREKLRVIQRHVETITKAFEKRRYLTETEATRVLLVYKIVNPLLVGVIFRLIEARDGDSLGAYIRREDIEDELHDEMLRKVFDDDVFNPAVYGQDLRVTVVFQDHDREYTVASLLDRERRRETRMLLERIVTLLKRCDSFLWTYYIGD